MAGPIAHGIALPVNAPAIRAFSLLEILVVIAILAILAAVLFPALQGSIHRARVAESTTRMQNLAKAIRLYAADNNMHFPGSGYGASTRWLHQVVPYLGIEPDGVRDGVSFYSMAYDLFDLTTCPVLHGKPIEGKSGTYPARFGMNRRLDPQANNSNAPKKMTGVSMLSVKRPAQTVLLATKANNAPSLHDGPYPDHQWGVSGNYERGRSPEKGMEEDGFIGRHAYIFCDGHLEFRDHFIGAEAFRPDRE
jgi:prepilin-type N-terminal cleavage/methylation domain-containing protein